MSGTRRGRETRNALTLGFSAFSFTAFDFFDFFGLGTSDPPPSSDISISEVESTALRFAMCWVCLRGEVTKRHALPLTTRMSSSQTDGAVKLSQNLLEEAEYMEDLESPSFQTQPADDPTSVTTSVVTTATVAVAVAKETAKKRQLNLTDMFSVTPGTKRQRTTSTGTASSASSPGGTSVPSGPPRLINGLRPFNSIPLNMDTYQSSLSEEEKKLLKLECETMGRTWVSRPPPLAVRTRDSSLSRSDLAFGRLLGPQLKVLSEEIRKPYFLKLKRFLWEEGVQGATEQSVGSPKIFPPRAFESSVFSFETHAERVSHS